MPASAPNFLPYPFERLPRVGKRELPWIATLAGWLGARERGDRLARLVGGSVSVELGDAVLARDPHAATAELRVGGVSLEISGASAAVRALTQRLLGGPPELPAPRPLGDVEQAVFALILATALEDAGIAGEVWPLPPVSSAATLPGKGGAPALVYLAVRLGDLAMTVAIALPQTLRAPPSRPWPRWFAAELAAVIVVARCAIARADLSRLAVRDVITVERALAFDVLGGTIGLAAAPHAVEATVATGYGRRDMALPDDAHLELTVALGTASLPLRRLADLAIGEVIALGRPLAGPFELRAAGRVIGTGELVDIDGELGVRVVSLAE